MYQKLLLGSTNCWNWLLRSIFFFSRVLRCDRCVVASDNVLYIGKEDERSTAAYVRPEIECSLSGDTMNSFQLLLFFIAPALDTAIQ